MEIVEVKKFQYFKHTHTHIIYRDDYFISEKYTITYVILNICI